jgi:hypothetical protein
MRVKKEACSIQIARRFLRRPPALLLSALIAAAAPSPAAAEGSVLLDFGFRFLNEDTWHPLDNHETHGLEVNYAAPDWPVALSLGWHASKEEVEESVFVPDGGSRCFAFIFLFCSPTGDTVERVAATSTLRELSAGVMKDWISDGARVRAFIGGGLSHVEASIYSREADFSDDDGSFGAWAQAGLVGAGGASRGEVAFELGVSIRALQGTRLRFEKERGNADYVQASLISGIRW